MRRHWPSCLACLLSAAALAPAATAESTIGQRAHATVERIASFGPRPAGSWAERRVIELLEDRFGALGYRVTFQSFPLPKGGWSNNVIAEPEGSGPPQVLVVAHHDGVRQGPAANDNGSGVAVLLEVARAFRGRAAVTFAALGAEERVETGSDLHLGSAALLESLGKEERKRLRLVLSLDMVGYGPTLNVRGLEPTPNASARQALAAAQRLGIRATYLQDTGQSDHAELTRGGVPAAWIQWRWDPCWHTACDTPDRVKTWKLSAAGRLAIAAVRDVLDEP